MASRDRKRTIVIVNWDKYHKPPRAALPSNLRGEFATEPLNWVRLDVNWHRDVDILEMKPEVRSLWPQLLAMAGASVPHGRLYKSVQELAKAGHLREADVAEALTFLWKRHKIRYSTADKNQPSTSRRLTRTYVPTNERTNGADSEKNDGGDASWIRDPELRRLVEVRRGRGA